MYSRLVSLLLIAAILACPVWCSMGVCCGGPCSDVAASQLNQADNDLCDLHQAANCCCCEGLPQEHNRSPRRVPPKPACQGICGGAVLQHACEVVGLPDCWQLIPKIEFRTQTTIELPEFEPQHVLPDRAGNVGRFTRTLHASLLV